MAHSACHSPFPSSQNKGASMGTNGPPATTAGSRLTSWTRGHCQRPRSSTHSGHPTPDRHRPPRKERPGAQPGCHTRLLAKVDSTHSFQGQQGNCRHC